MQVKILGSSSKGNCYIIDNSLILDAGVNIKDIKKALDFDFTGIKGCLLTHEHMDHAKSINSLALAGINIYSSKGTFEALKINNHKTHEIAHLKQFTLGGYVILPFDVQHDVREPLGFLIKKISTGEKLLFATDTYYLKYKFKDLNYIFIECNYSDKILQENHNNEKIHPVYAKRVKKSHMSLENLKDFFTSNNLSKCNKIVLLHLSSQNSDSEIFKKEISEQTGIETVIARSGLELDLDLYGF